MAVKMTRGESKRISLDWVTRPFSVNHVSGDGWYCCERADRTEQDESSTQSSGRSLASSSLEGQEHGGDRQDTTDGRKEAHGNIWNAGLDVVLANIFEIEFTVEAGQPAREGDEELCERRVYVHEESTLDVL